MGGLVLPWGVPAAPADPVPTPPPDALIARLGNERWEARESAQAQLLELGEAVRAVVTRALKSDDVEIRVRSRQILDDMDFRALLGALRREGEVFPEEELRQCRSRLAEIASVGNRARRRILREGGAESRERFLRAMASLLYQNRTDAPIAYEIAWSLLWLDRLPESVVLFRYVQKIDPGMKFAYNDCGNALNEMGDLDGAMAEYRRAAELFPNYSYPPQNMANVEFTRGNHAKALELWIPTKDLESVALSPTHLYRRGLGRMLDAVGRIQEAEAELNNAFSGIADDVGDIWTWRQRYLLYERAGDHEKARVQFDHATAAFGGRPETRSFESEVLCDEGRFREALRAVERLAASDGETLAVRCHRAQAVMGMGRREEARAILDDLLAQSPRHLWGLALSTDLALQTGRWADAVRHARERLRTTPRVPTVHAALAHAHAAADDPAVRDPLRARALLREAEELMAASYYYGKAVKNRATIQADLSWVSEAEGDYAGALQRFEPYARLRPWDADARRRLEILQSRARDR